MTAARIIELKVVCGNNGWQSVLVRANPDDASSVTLRTASTNVSGVEVHLEPASVHELIDALQEALAIIPSDVKV